LPADVQTALVRALPGLQDARIARPGYAVEYDFIQPTELTQALEVRRLPGLFLAGQINGTSGYEEAAGQGWVAGVNAGRRVLQVPPVSLGRDQAYIGIMVDDLVTKGCLEPYRMFTSRAEYRLLLRIDNADLRLTPLARELGLIDDEGWERFRARQARFRSNLSHVRRTTVRLASGERVLAAQAVRQPTINLRGLIQAGQLCLDLDPTTQALDLVSLETEIKYEGYLTRQFRAVEAARRQEDRRIPRDFVYEGIPGLSTEMVQRFEQVRPATLGQAGRVPGATPAAVAVVGAYLNRAMR
jgi:tRNA uridine 5-carboxymethylaminomethyl modification enzyme